MHGKEKSAAPDAADVYKRQTLNKDIRILNERIQKEFRTLRITRKQNHLFLNCDDIEKRRVLTYFLLEESEDQRFDVGILDRYFENVDVYRLSEILRCV